MKDGRGSENGRPDARGDARERESRRILDRVAQDSESLGTSSLARSANRARDHFAGADADPDDWAELWGRRIGRGASVVALVVLVVWLVGWLGR